MEVIWSIPQRLNGMNLLYFINVYRKNDQTKQGLMDLIRENSSSIILEHNRLVQNNSIFANDLLNYIIVNLQPYTMYFLEVRACNRDLRNNQVLYCLDGTASEGIYLTFIRFFTSQDRPENQTQPKIVTLNSSFLTININPPTKPNGIILLYEIWLRRFERNNTLSNSLLSLTDRQLACVIEELYDPYDTNLTNSFSIRSKNCTIGNLSPNTAYSIIATSSTIIGRSRPSLELNFTTLENFPSCIPRIVSLGSYASDKIYFSWLPDFNLSLSDINWKNCIGGNLKNFSIFQVDVLKGSEKLIFTGLESTFNLTKLAPSKDYNFRIEMCNGIGCIATNLLKVTTLDPPPNKWLGIVPKYTILNGTMIQFEWSDYLPFNKTSFSSSSQPGKSISSFQNVTYRLERAEIAFAYPPTPLEYGIRFHGYNYFKFSSNSNYFPDGYPYFGLKYLFKSKVDSALIYFAGSSFASQSELTLSQLVNGKSWFVTNTKSSGSDSCSGYLTTNETFDCKIMTYFLETLLSHILLNVFLT
jgi:hypothetical protein